MGELVCNSTVFPDGGTGRKLSMRSSGLALLFLVLAFPTVLIQVYCTPPIQVADEENHFLRALQVADGHLFGRKIEGDNAGGILDPAAPIFAHDFDALKFMPERKLDISVYGAAAALRWGVGSPIPTAFPNTAIYPFFLYLPASAGLATGRALQLSVLDSFYLGRLATALVSIALASMALAICGRGRSLLFVILCLPMTLSLFASLSQDAIAIALGGLAAATWSRYVADGVAMPAAVRATVALALGAVAAARIPLVPLYVLIVLPTRRSIATKPRPRLADVAAAAAGFIPFAIGIYGAHAAKIAFREEDGVSPIGQLHWIALHPIEVVAVVKRTLETDTLRHLRELVGVLGWLDTDLPPGFYDWMGGCVVLAFLIDAMIDGRNISGLSRFVPAAAVLFSSAGVFGAFYLAWTPVGAPIVDGVQGRYFIVPAMVLAVSLPGFNRLGERVGAGLKWLQLIICGAVALTDLWIVPIAILHRYYE